MTNITISAVDISMVTSVVREVSVSDSFATTGRPLDMKCVENVKEGYMVIRIWMMGDNDPVGSEHIYLYLVPVAPHSAIYPLPDGWRNKRYVGTVVLGFKMGRKGDSYDSVHVFQLTRED